MSHRTYFPSRGDFIHFDASPSAGREMAGPHFALVLSSQSYNRRTDMAIVLIATSKLKHVSNPRYGNVKYIPPGVISPRPGHPPAEGVLFCDAVRQIDWRERGATLAGKAPQEFVEDALDRLLSALDDD